MRNFSNVETREMFFDVLITWIEDNPHDPLSLAREWLEMSGADSAAQQLAKQLRKDLVDEYGGSKEPGQNIMLALIRSGLRRVKFREIAEQLLRFCQPAEAKADGSFDGLGYDQDDCV